MGLVRGVVPDLERRFEQAQHRIRQKDRQIKRMRRRLSDANDHIRELRQVQSQLEQNERRLEQAPEQPSGGQIKNSSGTLSYETLYESLIRAKSADVAIGGSSKPFGLIGRLELGVLLMEGLEPTDTLVDLGCGTGRLAIQAIPYLAGGHYVGIDISRTMLDAAQKRVEEIVSDPPSRVSWLHQTTPVFALGDDSVDMICAFSVFNHMEHEDTYLYLKEALRVVRPGGRFVFSCLPMNTERARKVFLTSAERDLQTRYSTVRHVATSKEMMNDIARLAGWAPVRWYDGDEKNIRLPDSGELHRFNQTICVLAAPHDN